MKIHLEVVEGPHEGRVFEFEQHSNFLVGRSDRVHFRLSTKDKFFSRVHFMIEANPPLCRLTDMGSTNGTLVNGKKAAAADLRDGDRITAGKTVLRVSLVHDSSDENSTTAIDAVVESPDTGLEDSAATRFPREGEAWPSFGAVGTTVDGWEQLRDEKSRPGPLCRSCAAPIVSTEPTTGTEPATPADGSLCAECRRLAGEHRQPIAGYRIVRELGRGGMGVVYLAVRTEDGQAVALKTIKPAVSPTSEETRRFLREARILAELDHPHIVAFREMGETDGLLHFAMDYVPGTDAARIQKEYGGPMPIPRAVGLVSQMLQALDHAHAKGYVHRDIKPGNLLVARERGRDHAKLADFGLARVYQNSKMSGLTMKGDLRGTFGFMAPEQITELQDAKPPVDQYSAGAMLYKLLTNRHVYDLPSQIQQLISMILLDDPVPILTRKPDLPEGLAAIVHRAIARDPSARFKDVKEMRRALIPYAE